MMTNHQWLIYKIFTSIVWAFMVSAGFYINFYVGIVSLTLGLLSIQLYLHSGFSRRYSSLTENMVCLNATIAIFLFTKYLPHWSLSAIILLGLWYIWFMKRWVYRKERYLNLQEALMTHKFVKREGSSSAFCYYKANTGPYKDLVDCDYFVTLEDGLLNFSTSAPDMYAEEILATNYEIFDISEEEVQYAKEASEKLENLGAT